MVCLQIFFTKHIIIHEDWTGNVEDGNDIALLMLEGESEHTPVRLPEARDTPIPGEALVAIGWGETENGQIPQDLQQATEIRFIDNNFCDDEDVWGPNIQSSMLCAFGFDNGQNVCKGAVLSQILLF